MTSIAPIIDISGYLAGDKSQIPKITSEIDRAFRTSGFFQLVGHGISQSQIDGMIKQTAEFFALPDETKRKIHGKMRGYQSPELRESLSSLAKEGFFMGRHMPGRNRPIVEGNLWLKEEDAPGFRQTMEEYFAAMENLAIILLRLIALGLGLEETYFDDFAKQPEGAVLCRFHRYHPTLPEEGDDVVGLEAHADTSAVTILYQDGIGGLQVKNEKTGEFETIEPIRDAFVINLGNMFARWTNDTYLAAEHRVLLPTDKFRYSAAYFMAGWLDQVIECLPQVLKAGEAPKYETCTVEQLVTNFRKEIYDIHTPGATAYVTVEES